MIKKQVQKKKVAALILAAGESTRMGQPKVLLDWRGKPLLWHAIQKAQQANFDPILVVLGAVMQPVEDSIQEFQITIVKNPDWKEGQSTSLKAGVAALPVDVDAVVVMLADQPLITVDLLEKEIELFVNHQAKLIAPRIDKRPSTPVLFARDYFEELSKSISGDQGGRTLLAKYPVMWLEDFPVEIFTDIDTLDDYQQLRASDK